MPEKTVMELPLVVVITISLCISIAIVQAAPPQNTVSVTPMVKTMPVLPNATARPSPAIVGGSVASSGFIKYQAAIFIDGLMFCGGSLISDSYVLTAGHCVDGSSHWIIYLGTVHLSVAESGRQIAQSIDATLHENYNKDTLENDIAILALRRPVLLTYSVQPVDLVTSNYGDLVGLPARVSGWGKTSDYSNSISEVLYYTDLAVISNTECSLTYGPSIKDGTICAFSNRWTNPCSGDSGGPLVALFNDQSLLVGVTSFVAADSCTGRPSGYARVSYYRDWIRRVSAL